MSRPDDTLVVAARQEVTEFLRHPAVHATDGVHYNLGGKRPLIPLDLDGDAHRNGVRAAIRLPVTFPLTSSRSTSPPAV